MQHSSFIVHSSSLPQQITHRNACKKINPRRGIVVTARCGVYIIAQAVFYIEKIVPAGKDLQTEFSLHCFPVPDPSSQ